MQDVIEQIHPGAVVSLACEKHLVMDPIGLDLHGSFRYISLFKAINILHSLGDGRCPTMALGLRFAIARVTRSEQSAFEAASDDGVPVVAVNGKLSKTFMRPVVPKHAIAHAYA